MAEDKPNIFFIIGAPTQLTVKKFREFCKKFCADADADDKATKQNVKLAICADIDTHKKSLECENVFKTPTNFRAHGDDKGHAFLTMDGDKEVKKSLDTLDDFKKLQKDTAESIYDILKYARDNDIHTYFASVPRKLRPILLHKELGNKDHQIKMIEDEFGKVDEDGSKILNEDGSIELSEDGIMLKNILETKIHSDEGFKVKYPKDEGNGLGLYPHIISGKYILKNVDFELIDLILGKLGDKEKKNLRDNINKKEISKHGATFLADVITVGCALLIRDETAWKHYDISFDEGNNKGEKKTKPKIYWGNSKFQFANEGCKCAGVQQENISYKETANESSFFHGFNAEQALIKLTGKMKEVLEQGELKKIWGNCYVWHDDKLNDVDDEPAITLIRQLSTTVKECKSYTPVKDDSAVSSTGGYKKSYGKKKKTKKTRRKTKNMRRKSKSKTKTKKKNTRKKKHYKKRKSKTHKKR
jgi:hypothetical protein